MSLPRASVRSKTNLLDTLALVLAIVQGSDVLASILTDVSGMEASRIVTPVWLLLYGWAALRLVQADGIGWLPWLLRYRLILVLVLVAVPLSVAWSIDPHLTLLRAVHFVGTTLVAFYIGYLFPLKRLMWLLAVMLGALLVLSAMAALLLPSLGIGPYEGRLVWEGLFSDKNSLGFAAATGMLLFAILFLSAASLWQRLLFLTLAAVALLDLLGSQSATSLVAMSAGLSLMLFFFLVARMGLNRAAAVLLALCGASVLLLGFFGVDFSALFSVLGRSSDLTGRKEIWDAVKYLISQHPWTGTGYGTIWFPTPESEWQQQMLNLTWLAHHAHNGFYQVASQLGLPLTALAILFLLQMQIEAVAIYLRSPVVTGALFLIGFQVAFLVANGTEAYFMVDRHLFWMLQLALPIALLREVEMSQMVGSGAAAFDGAVRSGGAGISRCRAAATAGAE